MSVKIEGFLESTLRDIDGSVVTTEQSHNTVMISAVKMLAKNLSYKNKGGRSIIRFRSETSFAGLLKYSNPEGISNSSNIDGHESIFTNTDGKNEDGQNEFIVARSNNAFPSWLFIDPGKTSSVSAITLNVMKYIIYTSPHNWSKLKTPCNWSIYGSYNSVDGITGEFELIQSFIDDTWDYSPINGIDKMWMSKTIIFPQPKTYKSYKIVFQTVNTEGGSAMEIKSVYLHESIMGLRRIKIGTNDLNGGTPDGVNTLTDLNNPVTDSNLGYAKGFTSGTIDLEQDVTFEYPDTIKIRYKWINTLSTDVTVREVGAYDYNNGNPALVSRIIRNTVVKPMQYLDDIYKIKISVN